MLARQSSPRSRSSAEPASKKVLRAASGKLGDRQQCRCCEIGHDEANALRREVAEARHDIAASRHNRLYEFERLAGEAAGGLIVGNAEPRALDALVLRRLAEIGERQRPFDGLRQPPDLDRLLTRPGRRCRENAGDEDRQRRSRAAPVTHRFGPRQISRTAHFSVSR